MIAAVLAAPAHAITVAPLSFEELVRQSSSIVYGRVTDVQSHWTEDRQAVESVVSIEVFKGLKGANAPAVSLVVPGGQVGRYLNLVPGAPTFSRGDLAIVFLTSRGARLPIATGFTQGIYRVTTMSGQPLVTPPAIEASGSRVGRGDLRRKPVAIDVFEAAVRSVK